MSIRSFRVALLLFGSGFCALIYQTTWLREFRLIFGGSTPASAVVIGVFMAGIGFGGIVLGQRSEVMPRPLKFYAQLELMIAIAAALSPLLIVAARQIYIALGGTQAMGIGLGTVVRLALAAVIIGIPTFLMGGTLPAAARSAVEPNDISRRGVGLLYGTNTLGAVAGAFAGTFYCFEHLGNRVTLWTAAAINLLIALIAFAISKSTAESKTVSQSIASDQPSQSAGRRNFVFTAAAIVGFAFFLMEMVWYRMLGPLLGGSIFSFGLILAVALFGIGVGGLLYAMLNLRRAASLQLFAFTCAAEALLIGIPFALGDRLAMAAMLLRPIGTMGFFGHVIAWSELCGIVIFPAAAFAGLQFPLLIALLGQGRTRVGSETGVAYAWNTIGALLGSLAGGFGLIPLLSAPGVWKLVIVLLGVLALVAILFAVREGTNRIGSVPSALIVVLALLSVVTIGPTAFWRHSEIGVGAITKFQATPNELHDLVQMNRRTVFWEKDGIESSVALAAISGLTFLVNGRADGNAKGDAGTQVMCGLIGAALHPHPGKAMVVGLGTGSTAGWLAAVPAVERVDVVELEPAIRTVAEKCAPVNHDALDNPKLRLVIGDAREFLLTTHEKYDLVASEPSNPYRAGVASLFTREFYQSVEQRLQPDGIFCQWVQAYDIDDRTIHTIYRTLRSVFPNVESWQTEDNDLMLVASREPIHYNADQLRARLSEEPYKSALLDTWRADGIEDFFGHYLGNQEVAAGLSRLPSAELNTDDRTLIEFSLARAVGRNNGFRNANLRAAAHRAHVDRPLYLDGDLDWNRVEEARLCIYASLYPVDERQTQLNAEQRDRAEAFASYRVDDLPRAWQRWRNQPAEPQTPVERTLVAECLAAQGNSAALRYIDELEPILPIDAEAIRAHLLFSQGNALEANQVIQKVFTLLRNDPWLPDGLTRRSLRLAVEIGNASPSNETAIALYHTLQEPFAIRNEEAARLTTLFNLGIKIDGNSPGQYSQGAVELHEPNVPWQQNFLHVRQLCYEASHDPRAEKAKRDFDEFVRNEPINVNSMATKIQSAGSSK
jgi:spermidine synthase